VTLSTYALINVAELRPALQGGYSTDSSLDDVLADVINDVSETIERDLDRYLVTRGPTTGYFTPLPGTAELYPYEWPLISVTSVHESSARTYDATTALTVGTDYVVTNPAHGYGYLTRVLGATGGRAAWAAAWRAVRIVYRSGYATTDDVPAAIKRVAKRLAVTTWGEWRRGQADLQQESSGLGTFTRFSAAFLTKDMRAELAPFRRLQWFSDFEEVQGA
jgi:hypothetical protein